MAANATIKKARCLAVNPEPFHRRLLSHGCLIRSFASGSEKFSLAAQSFRARRQTSVSAVEPPKKRVLCTPALSCGPFHRRLLWRTGWTGRTKNWNLYGFVRICTEGDNQIQRVFSPYPSVPICTNPYSTKKHRHQASECEAEKPDPEKAANER